MNAVSSHLSVVDSAGSNRFQQITSYYEKKYEISWIYMHAAPRPCFTMRQLKELNHALGKVREQALTQPEKKVRYNVMASKVDGVFNLGGDLDSFKGLIERRDRERLSAYAMECIDAVYTGISNFRGANVTSIALVQGLAFGGGLECALASDLLIAERGSRMGFPEVIFNLFPGMGAYSLLSRKLTPATAKRMILSGKLYGAEELHEMGVVDVLVDDGEGELAVYEYVKNRNRSANAYASLTRAVDRVNPVSYEELRDVALIWVEAALNLGSRDLRMMDRLVTRQNRDWASTNAA
ncbi:MAG: crotonase/enoyl-CoA hydratase family protein [Gammaproteobacteria bacterium]|nr:crotonase/enoyl-CoA hydratase family protein [Gammaproteobacteria bacterium]